MKNSRSGDGQLPPLSPEHDARPPSWKSLSAALDAEKGLRGRAVQLVIVEQTLRQGVPGGLSAVPEPVLIQAFQQIQQLPQFDSSESLRSLARHMSRLIEPPPLTPKTRSSLLTDSPHQTSADGKPMSNVFFLRPEPGLLHAPATGPDQAHIEATHGFPDTQGWDTEEERTNAISWPEEPECRRQGAQR